jgi:hypothetical protein
MYKNVKNSTDPKQQLIEYIFNTIDVSKFKYELLQFESELSQLLKQKYYISANFSGYNCLLVFTKIHDRYFSVIIDRKTLSYNISKVDISKVKITNINLKLDLSIYMGTIFDGIYIINKNNKLFIVTDVYYFRGQDFTNTHLNTKLLTVFTYLQSNYNANDNENNLLITANKVYELKDIEHLVNTTIPKSKDIPIKGICFYPEISGTKLIYLFGNENKIVETEKVIVKSDEEKHKFIPKKDVEYVFEMKCTPNADVYDLNVVEIEERNNKKLLKRVFVDIAYIPNISRSKWCTNMLKDKKSILVKCKYYIDKSKWEPVEISDRKYPSLITDF